MKLLLVACVLFVSLINGLMVGPAYTVPVHQERPDVTSVLPRLGASSVSLKVDEEWRVYTTGGWAYLPSQWPAAFADCEALTETHAITEVTVYFPETNQWKYSHEGVWGDLNNARAFHIVETFNGSIFVWGGGSEILEVSSGDCTHWEEISVRGPEPNARFAASSEVVDTTLYIFGGVENDGVAPEDFIAFDFETNEWFTVNVTSMETPPPRYGASLDHYEGVLVLYGGTDVTTGLPFNDLWFFSLDSREWYYYNASEFEVAGSTFHGSAVFENELFIFLGEGGVFWRDIWVFNFETGNWSISEKLNNVAVPPVRSGFSYALVGEAGAERVIVLGGVRDTKALVDTYALQAEAWSVDLYDLKWTRESCYPSYVFDEHAYVCVHPTEDDCESCESCTDMAPHRLQYVSKLKNKILNKDWTGVLRQCPAYWTKSELVL